MLDGLQELSTRIIQWRATKPAATPREASANVGWIVRLAGAALGVLMAVAAHAQGYPAATPGMDLSQGSNIPLPNGTQQHYVGPHFDAQGKYVGPHYEGLKTMPFRGYYPEDEAKREASRHHGYDEPPPDYSTPDTPQDKPVEGR